MKKQTRNEGADGDVTHLIERLDVFEERVGVRLEALFAHIECDGEFLSVNGEVHPREGTKIKDDIYVHLGAYDSSGRLVAQQDTSIQATKFFGFEPFNLLVSIPISQLSKIRIYPKLG